jgi:hypothetical protein
MHLPEALITVGTVARNEIAGAPPRGPLAPGWPQCAVRRAGALGIPPMPTWAMISVIVGWSGLGAWRMMTRDA